MHRKNERCEKRGVTRRAKFYRESTDEQRHGEMAEQTGDVKWDAVGTKRLPQDPIHAVTQREKLDGCSVEGIPWIPQLQQARESTEMNARIADDA